MTRKTIAGVVVVVFAVMLPPALAEEQSAGDNVRITIEIGKLQGSRKDSVSTYQLVTEIGSKAQLNVGSRVPIPTATASPSDGEAPKVLASYSYQNIGMSGAIETARTSDGRIYVRGDIDASLIRNQEGSSSPANPPTMGTFNQHLSVGLAAGKPVRVAEVTEPGQGGFYIEIRADLPK